MIERGRHVAPQAARWNRVLAHDFLEQGRQRARRKGPLPGDQLVEHDAEAEHVAVVRKRILLDLLGRHVRGRAQPYRLDFLGVAQVGSAEVADLDVGALAHHDIRGLDVAMHDAVAKRVIERAAALEDDFHRAVDRQGNLAADVGREIASGHVLHHDVAGVVGEHRVVNGDDVRVAQFSGKRGLDLELRPIDFPESRMAEERAVDDLERHLLVGKGIDGEIHRRRRALAERLLDLVFADACGKAVARGVALPAELSLA